MKSIQKLNYKEFETEFFILPKVDEFLKSNKVEYKEFLLDNYQFYEVEVFEILDEDQDGIPDRSFGNKFKVVYFGIIEKLVNSIPEGFDEIFEHGPDKFLAEISQIVPQTKEHRNFKIKYKILKE